VFEIESVEKQRDTGATTTSCLIESSTDVHLSPTAMSFCELSPSTHKHSAPTHNNQITLAHKFSIISRWTKTKTKITMAPAIANKMHC
jgi:hypothetical protein